LWGDVIVVVVILLLFEDCVDKKPYCMLAALRGSGWSHLGFMGRTNTGSTTLSSYEFELVLLTAKATQEQLNQEASAAVNLLLLKAE
jgi:hypothetical protein